MGSTEEREEIASGCEILLIFKSREMAAYTYTKWLQGCDSMAISATRYEAGGNRLKSDFITGVLSTTKAVSCQGACVDQSGNHCAN